MLHQRTQTRLSGQCSSDAPCIWSGEMRSHRLNLQRHKFKVLDQIIWLHIQWSIGTQPPKGTAESALLARRFKTQVRHISQRQKHTQYWPRSRGFTTHVGEGLHQPVSVLCLYVCLCPDTCFRIASCVNVHITQYQLYQLAELESSFQNSSESSRTQIFFFFQPNCAVLWCI